MRYIRQLIITILLLQVAALFGQDLSTRSKKAARAFEEAGQWFRLQDYDQAERELFAAIGADSLFFEAWVVLGELYEETGADDKAIAAYREAVRIDPHKYPPAFYYMGLIEYRNGIYADALAHLETYLTYGQATLTGRDLAEKYVANCRFALKAMDNPVPFQPVNLGGDVNTEFNEYFPCLTADNQTLLFTRLVDDPGSFTGRQEDFFISTRSGGEWQPAVNIGPPINTLYNEGAPTLSADGNVLVFTACESVNGYGEGRRGYGRCDLFISTRRGLSWSRPENAGVPVNSGNWESQPSLAADGRTLYFVSNRDNDYDIWMSTLDENGDWSLPEMLGGNINTSGYEGSVFIHPDNQTLYFSSDGHTGMGGMDIFYSRRDSTGDWGRPVNLGYPINTHKDENSILISADGGLAMFASDREAGFGGLDLYQFELYEEARPQYVTYLKGTVFDEETRAKLGARFELTDLETGEVAVRSFSNEQTGEFLVSLPTNRDYALTVSRDGYLFYSGNFSLRGSGTTADPYLKDIPMKPIKVGETVVLRNIFFETDKYALKEASVIELDKLAGLLESNPGVSIEIAGHTDNVGTPDYNLELSRNRARAVYDYLAGKGIDPARLSYKGYGETSPVDTNDTEAGRANNRRTEFVVVDGGGGAGR